MSAQGGLKHVATEPTQLDNKRERRRVEGRAGGRAAVLRRAPSDSDCSGETASLSADSGERRPPPAQHRHNKTRSRRRGSEWEVLEGLKDGQRFDRRPEVFNGYLHKKRKWPLKGWHKRFFVVDGGILVYARSPSDVARGRLHGSVDVGLSVISAKPRRRRIDIDADEFIYHLRAKTPDVFRTWLAVLKAHRLYRQHLLTFGARESVPKIHAPLEDLPPAEASSRSSSVSSLYTSSTMSSYEHSIEANNSQDLPNLPNHSVFPIPQKLTCYQTSVVPLRTTSRKRWNCKRNESHSLMPLTLENFDLSVYHPLDKNNYRSLCSMNCMQLINRAKSPDSSVKSRNVSVRFTDTEDQVVSTNLDLSSFRNDSPKNSPLLYQCSLEPSRTKQVKVKAFISKESCKSKTFTFNKQKETTALFLFPRKRRSDSSSITNSVMKKSKKCTNLVKYRNLTKEPVLKRPLSNNMLLLSKYKLENTENTPNSTTTACGEDNSPIITEHKSLQHEPVNDYDQITAKLMTQVFSSVSAPKENTEPATVITCVKQIVQELYELKIDFMRPDPVKTLFKSLLEFWLHNSSLDHVKQALTPPLISIQEPTIHRVTTDKNISSACIDFDTKCTQVDGYSFVKKLHSHTKSFEKGQRIEDLERILKNTVYFCETCTDPSKERDIKITKKLIDNLEKLSKKSLNNSNGSNDNSNSSTELPQIKETINRLISETSIPPGVAKEVLGAYLDVLLHDSRNSNDTHSSISGENSAQSPDPHCEVQSESVNKKVSRSIVTIETNQELIDAECKTKEKNDPIDSGQLYLRDILDKITTIFKTKMPTITKKSKSNTFLKIKTKKDDLRKLRKDFPGKKLIHENKEDNSIALDLSKYDLQNITMYSDPNNKAMMSITLMLKEKKSDSGVSNMVKKNSKCFDDNSQIYSANLQSSNFNIKKFNSNIAVDSRISFKNPYMNLSANRAKNYNSSSDATSKACYKVAHESEHSLDLIFQNSKLDDNSAGNDTQPCYIISAFKKNTSGNIFQIPKKSGQEIMLRDNETGSTQSQSNLTEFEKPPPRVIDERFILLLLENLSFLSQSVPSLHKDINSLYQKLKKRHEKLLKHTNDTQGLGLLGKIYNEDTPRKVVANNQTQFDVCFCPGNDCADLCVQANSSIQPTRSYKDICVSAFLVEKDICDFNGQTDNENTMNLKMHKQMLLDAKNNDLFSMVQSPQKRDIRIPNAIQDIFMGHTSEIPGDQIYAPIQTTKKFSNKTRDSISPARAVQKVEEPNVLPTKNLVQVQSSVESVPSIDEVHVTNYDEINKSVDSFENNNNRIIKIIGNIIKNVDSKNFKIVGNKPLDSKVKRVKDRNSIKMKHNLMNEIRMLSPYKSTESQTDWKHVKQFTATDFNVYRLYVSPKYAATGSITDSNRLKNDDLKTLFRSSSTSECSELISPSAPLRGPQAGFVSGTPGGRLASWIIESGGPLESASRELGQAQLSVQQLQRLLDACEMHHQVHHDTDVSLEGVAASPNVKKDRRKFGLRKKKSNSKCASVELAPPYHIDPSSSHTALSALTAPPSPGGGASSAPNSAASLPIACAAARPQSLPGAESLAAGGGPASLSSLTPDQQLREDFTVLAKDLLGTLKGVVATLVCERGRLRAAMEAAETTATPGGAVMAALRTNLSSALQQNSELRSRLSRIHDASDLAEMSSVHNSDQATRQFQQSLSYSSSCVSASEFFDAEEHENEHKPTEILADVDETGVIELDGDSSSEAGSLSSEEGSASSDNSDGAPLSAEPITLRAAENGLESRAESLWTRRTCLPCARPTPGGPSLWNLLYKNIGKDLSQISMPVTINEPLNMLQRLCEELEYSELLEAAASCPGAVERMSLVAAFAVSAYAASAHRAASKPFNPLLHETYECVRDDRGFRFLAEQVSHHPPISACHAESSRWCFWQEARIKTKFWGKSMEFQPTGRVHLRLLPTGDHYSWNKVTTCVHNLFGGQRWVDQYGDMHITCHGTDITCKLNFIKASSWSSSRHEVRGCVSGGGARVRLQGRWDEALYAGDPPAARCLWRPGTMPAEHELYYGFTRFAMELNEMEPGMNEQLPYTDTRFRPDQRALEEGAVESAEQYKHALEQAQRDRRRDAAEHPPAWFRKSVEGGEEMWVFTGEYWRARDAGFPQLSVPRIW